MKNTHIFQTLQLLRNECKEDEALKHENHNNKQKTLEVQRELTKIKLDRLVPGKKAAKKRARNIAEEQRLEQALNDIEKNEKISEIINNKDGDSELGSVEKTKTNSENHVQDKPKKSNSDDDFIVGI